MNEQTSMKDDFAKALVDAPGHAIRYVGGLIIALLGDYTLITLVIFVVLLGLVTHSVLIPAAVFFGAYFLLRVVSNVAEAIGYHANQTAAAQARNAQVQSQAIMQVAGVMAQRSSGTVVEGDTLP